MALGTVLTLLGAGRPWRSRQGRAGSRRLGKLLEAVGPLLPSGGSPLVGVCGPGAGRWAGRRAWPGDGTELNVRGQVSSPSPDLTVSPQTRCPPSVEPPAGQGSDALGNVIPSLACEYFISGLKIEAEPSCPTREGWGGALAPFQARLSLSLDNGALSIRKRHCCLECRCAALFN